MARQPSEQHSPSEAPSDKVMLMVPKRQHVEQDMDSSFLSDDRAEGLASKPKRQGVNLRENYDFFSVPKQDILSSQVTAVGTVHNAPSEHGADRSSPHLTDQHTAEPNRSSSRFRKSPIL